MNEGNAPTRLSRVDRLLDLCPAVADVNELLTLLSAAREAYVNGTLAGPKELSECFPKLPREVCQKMVEMYGWRKQRAERLEDLQVASAIKQAHFIGDVRTSVAKGLVDQLGPAVKLLTDEIGISLGDADSKYRTMDARRLAEAVAQLADKLMKAASVDGTVPELPKAAQAETKDSGKRPWLNITAAGPVTVTGGNNSSTGRGGPSEQQKTGEDDERDQ